MELFKKRTYSPRPAELAAIEAPLGNGLQLPDNTDITVFLGGHTDKEEFDALRPLLGKTDIFVPEQPEWTDEQLVLLSQISQGDKKARSRFLHLHGKPFPFAIAETKAILESGVRITLIDIPAHDKRAEEISEHFSQRATHAGVLPEVVHSFRKSLDNIVRLADKEARIEDYREDIMARSIGPRLAALIENDQELQSKKRVKVLIQLGGYHTILSNALSDVARANPTIRFRRIFAASKPILFDHFDRITRADRANTRLSTEARRELAMRAIGRAGLSINAIPLVIEERDYISRKLVLPHVNIMVERLSEDAIREFQKHVAEINKSDV